MTTNLGSSRSDLRVRLEEFANAPRFWTDSELNTWLNEGVRVVARRAEVIQSFNTAVAAVVNQQKYNLPTDVVRVHRMEFVPTGSTQVYPMMNKTDDEMDQVWGINPLSQSSYPSFFTLWGMPGRTNDAQLKMKVYPVPAQTGTFQIYYYRTPILMVADGDEAEVPNGWDDLIVLYAESIALLKDRDERWKDVRQLFENEVSYLIDMTRQLTDNQRQFITSTGSATPQWLYEFWDG